MEKARVEELFRLVQECCELPVSSHDHEVLLNFLRARKGNVDRAFDSLKAYFKLKKTQPQWFLTEDEMEASHCEQVRQWRKCVVSILSEKDELGRTMVALFPMKHAALGASFDVAMSATVQICEELSKDSSVHENGVVVIEDLDGLTMRGAGTIQKEQRRLFFHLLQDCLPLRVAGVHAVRGPWYTHLIFNLFKPFLSKKMRARYFVYRNIEALTKNFEKDLLPKQLGGLNPSTQEKEAPSNVPPAWQNGYLESPMSTVGPTRLA